MASVKDPATGDLAQSLVQAVLAAAEPGRLLQSAVDYIDGQISVGLNNLSVPSEGRMLLIAIGKAAPAMTSAALEIFGDRINDGLLTLLPDQEFPNSGPIQAFQAGHPLPDEGSLAAGSYAADILQDLKPEDRVLVLISGGGSAMFELLPPGITLETMRSLTDSMMRRGCAIDQINQVRRRLSLVKAGGLVQLAAPAMTIGLILSDVVGNHLDLVASGPTMMANDPEEGIEALLESHGLWSSLPEPVKDHLAQPIKPGGTIFRPVNLLIGSNQLALTASEATLGAEGFTVRLHTNSMQGEAVKLGRAFAAELESLEPGEALVMGGEATVTTGGGGRGGPMLELALAAALELADGPPRQLLTLATDGIDGNSPAAGALVDQGTIDRMRQQGIDPAASLSENDSYRALQAVEATVETGSTGTNINDIVIGWCPQNGDG